AMTLGQRVAVLRDGRLQQVDTPQNLYRDPDNLFVAAFIGSPSMNLVEARLHGDAVEFGGFRIPLAPSNRPALDGARVVVGIRPEAFEDAAFADGSLPQLETTVAVVEDLGSDTHVIFPVEAPSVSPEELRSDTDAEPLLGGHAVFNARVDAETSARPGAPIRLAVDPAKLYFFDARSGARLRAASAAQVA
ncbi:MAG TPA: ABC transporter ATP-binding protein, partial [Gaiellaceae bacterium]|nr:ABC transporter ATP-binding protein [Gaiellaceae bacterium]